MAMKGGTKSAKQSSKGSGKTKSGGMSAGKRDSLPAKAFAFPKQRKEPLNDAKHVRNAISRFDQVEGVSDRQRDAAWRRIRRAAKESDVVVTEKSWRELGARKAKSQRKSESRPKTA